MIKVNILIKGAYGDANVGDDLLLEMTVDLLSQLNRNIDIKIVCKKEKYLEQKYSSAKFLSLAASRFESPDIYILGGGTQFFSFERSEKLISRFSRFSSYLKILMKEPFLLFRILVSKLKSQKGIKLKLAIGIGLGPFVNENDEAATKKALEGYNKVYCRDRISLQYLEKWEFSKMFFGADICLSDLFSNKYQLAHKRPSGDLKLGIVLRDWPHDDTGEIINSKILDWLPKQVAYEKDLFVFSELKDDHLIQRVLKRSDLELSNLVVWHPSKYHFMEFYGILNECDILLTTRYHAAVFALNLGIPTICLGIDPKLEALCNEVDGFYYWHAKEDIKIIDDYVRSIESNYVQYQENIKLSYIKLNARSNAMVDDALNVLRNFK